MYLASFIRFVDPVRREFPPSSEEWSSPPREGINEEVPGINQDAPKAMNKESTTLVMRPVVDEGQEQHTSKDSVPSKHSRIVSAISGQRTVPSLRPNRNAYPQDCIRTG